MNKIALLLLSSVLIFGAVACDGTARTRISHKFCDCSG